MALTKMDEQKLAKELVDEVLAEFKATVPASDLEAMRTLLEMDLLCTDEGRARLRAIAPDPHVDRSGEVAREPAVKGRKARGS